MAEAGQSFLGASPHACSRCGGLADEGSFVTYNAKAYCPSCARFHRLELRPSRWAILSLVLVGLGALCALVPLVPAGVLLACRELQRIDAGQAPLKGRPYADVARVLGLVLIAGFVLAAIAVVAMSWD